MTVREIIAALRRAYPPSEWALFEELRCSVGFGVYAKRPGDPNPKEQRIDAWAMNTWEARGLRTVAFEIKCARSDWLRELKQPEKRAAAMARSGRFYFVAPKGIIRRDEVPEDCGLIEIQGEAPGARVRHLKRAPVRPESELERGFVAMILRRACEAVRIEEESAIRSSVDAALAELQCQRELAGLPGCGESRPPRCAPCSARQHGAAAIRGR